MRRIVILGCGFGGLRAAQRLEHNLAARRRVRITVVSARPDFVYTPLLPSVATGELSAAHISFALRDVLAPTTELLLRPVSAVDLQARCLRSPEGDVPFDYLLVAAGSQVDWGEHSEWQDQALRFHNAHDAQQLREALTRALQEAAAMPSDETRRQRLTFVVGGGGPTGVELGAALLSALKRDTLLDDFPQLARAVRMIIVERGPRLLPQMPEALGELARTHLSELGMELRLGTSVVSRTPHEVGLSTGEVIAAEHLIWCGGVKASELAKNSGFELSADGRIRINKTLKARADGRPLPGVFALGDIACSGADSPRSAQVAAQQANDAAYNIIADMSGRAYRTWEHRGGSELVSIGREQAIAYVSGSAIEGRAARALYRLVHTALMPGRLKKASLLKDWLLTSQRFDP